MGKLIIDLDDLDSVTRREIEHLVEAKLNEHAKIRGQIARDLSRIGTDAFLNSSAYDKLKAKYRVAHAGKKKLEILEMERKAYCK